MCTCGRLPRVDYSSGAGGAALEATVYNMRMPLAYVPSYGSGLPPTGMTLPQRAGNAAAFGALKAINAFISAPMVYAMRCAPLAGGVRVTARSFLEP